MWFIHFLLAIVFRSDVQEHENSLIAPNKELHLKSPRYCLFLWQRSLQQVFRRLHVVCSKQTFSLSCISASVPVPVEFAGNSGGGTLCICSCAGAEWVGGAFAHAYNSFSFKISMLLVSRFPIIFWWISMGARFARIVGCPFLVQASALNEKFFPFRHKKVSKNEKKNIFVMFLLHFLLSRIFIAFCDLLPFLKIQIVFFFLNTTKTVPLKV